ncbi:Protein ALP1-like [Linum perenne]
MNCRCFAKLCRLLAYEGGLRSSWNIEIDEMVAIFLYTIAHNEKNLVLQVVFRRSGETISRVIHLVLIAVLKLQNCVGALDGTHITLRVPKESQQRYRTRKGTLAMNVLGVCNPDMEFIYTLAGWEGSAQDGRVLRDALIRPNGLKVSKGLSFDLIHVSCVLIDKSNSCKQYWCTIFFTSVDNHFLSNRALLLSRCRL